MEILIKIDTLNEININQIHQLGKMYYKDGHNLLNKDYLRWLYLLNPLGSAKGCLAYHDDILIGIIVLVPIKITGTDFDCFYACNVLTHPNYRNHNIFIKMIRKVKDDFNQRNTILVGHPNKTSVPGWRRTKMNFQSPLKPKLFLSNPLKCNAKRYKDNASELDTFFSQLNLRSHSTRAIRVDMDFSYFKWRYIDCPVQLYKVFLTWDNKRINGIYVTKKLNTFFDLVVYSNSLDLNYDLTNYNSFLSLGAKVAYFSEDKASGIETKSKLFNLDKLDKDLVYFFTYPEGEHISDLNIHLGLECTDI